jgi:putative iron-dependent peroxidase
MAEHDGARSSTRIQPAILAPVPAAARYLTFSLQPGASPRRALTSLAAFADGNACVAGIGDSLLRALNRPVAGMRAFPTSSAAGFEVPATPAALWCWLRGSDRGALLNQSRALAHALGPAFVLDAAIDAFRHGKGLDLTGYEDGTENPRGRKAVAAVAVDGMGAGYDGSAFVAVQQWVHDLDRFQAMSQREQDHTVGRRKRDNVELERAPASAHVKRTAQESFQPEAFVVRRSMPWNDGTRAGLVFVAFGRSLDAYEAQLRRMVGAEDGITDALFKFTRPVTGAYFWCPPMKRGRLDLSRII